MQTIELRYFNHVWLAAPVYALFAIVGAAMTCLAFYVSSTGEPNGWVVFIASAGLTGYIWYMFYHALRFGIHRWVRLDENGITVSDWTKGACKIAVEDILRVLVVKKRWDEVPEITIIHKQGATSFPPRIGLDCKHTREEVRRWCEDRGIAWLSFPLGTPAPPEVFHQ